MGSKTYDQAAVRGERERREAALDIVNVEVRRVVGAGDLWVTEYVILYDGKPSYTVSIMEFEGGKVARETQYFGDPFEASAWRSRWVEPMDKGAKPFVES